MPFRTIHGALGAQCGAMAVLPLDSVVGFAYFLIKYSVKSINAESLPSRSRQEINQRSQSRRKISLPPFDLMSIKPLGATVGSAGTALYGALLSTVSLSPILA